MAPDWTSLSSIWRWNHTHLKDSSCFKETGALFFSCFSLFCFSLFFVIVWFIQQQVGFPNTEVCEDFSSRVFMSWTWYDVVNNNFDRRGEIRLNELIHSHPELHSWVGVSLKKAVGSLCPNCSFCKLLAAGAIAAGKGWIHSLIESSACWLMRSWV